MNPLHRVEMESVGLVSLGYQEFLLCAIDMAVEAAIEGPCEKSKRGATAFAVHGQRMVAAHNAPPGSFKCQRNAACRAACGQFCNHAEERAVQKFIAQQRAFGEIAAFDVVHIEVVDGEPMPFNRPGKPQRPSCITCARGMMLADVRLVWLYGVDGWRWWFAHDFMRDTILELGLFADDDKLAPRICQPGATE